MRLEEKPDLPRRFWLKRVHFLRRFVLLVLLEQFLLEAYPVVGSTFHYGYGGTSARNFSF